MIKKKQNKTKIVNSKHHFCFHEISVGQTSMKKKFDQFAVLEHSGVNQNNEKGETD